MARTARGVGCRQTPSRSLVLVFDLTSHFLFPQQRFVFRVQSRDLDLNSVPLRQPRPFQLLVQLSQQSLNCFLSSVHLNVQSPLFRVSLQGRPFAAAPHAVELILTDCHEPSFADQATPHVPDVSVLHAIAQQVPEIVSAPEA